MATNSAQIAKTGKFGDLRNRLVFLLLALVVYRVGAHIPVPGIDPGQLKELFKGQQGGILNLFNMFSGGALSMEEARRNMTKVSLRNGTLHHNVFGHHGAANVMMAPAPKGTGIIAGGPMRAVFEVMGITDIVAKSHGSSNPYNMVRATMDALKNSTTATDIAAKRGKSVEEIFG